MDSDGFTIVQRGRGRGRAAGQVALPRNLKGNVKAPVKHEQFEEVHYTVAQVLGPIAAMRDKLLLHSWSKDCLQLIVSSASPHWARCIVFGIGCVPINALASCVSYDMALTSILSLAATLHRLHPLNGRLLLS